MEAKKFSTPLIGKDCRCNYLKRKIDFIWSKKNMSENNVKNKNIKKNLIFIIRKVYINFGAIIFECAIKLNITNANRMPLHKNN